MKPYSEYAFETAIEHHTSLISVAVTGKIDAGRVVEQCWDEIPRHFSDVALDAFVVMPNHIHGILVIADNVWATHASPIRKIESRLTVIEWRGTIARSIENEMFSAGRTVTERNEKCRILIY